MYKEIIEKPVVQEANDAWAIPSLIADLSIRGYGSHCLIYILTLHHIHIGMLLLFYHLLKKRRENIVMHAVPP